MDKEKSGEGNTAEQQAVAASVPWYNRSTQNVVKLETMDMNE